MKDHPIIERMELYGYLEEDEPIAVDYFGNAIYCGDEVVQDEDGELVLKEFLREFLETKYKFKFGELGDWWIWNH